MKLFGYEVKRVKPEGIANFIPRVNEGKLLNGTVTWQGSNQEDQVVSGFSGNDIVYSIVRLITDKVKVPCWEEVDIKDEASFKQYRALMKNPTQIKDFNTIRNLRTKAFQPTKNKTKISDLLQYPNEQDSFHDIVEAYATFKLITGNSYVYGKTIQAGKNAGMPNELFVLPSQYMSILADMGQFPVSVAGYQLYLQFIENFTKEQILHDKYFNPNWNIAGNQLYGLSPLQAASKVLTRSNEGKQAAVSNYQNGGPKGILFMADDRFDPNLSVREAIDIKKTLARNQGSKNVNQIETTGYKVDYVPLGLSPVDLDLLNAENMDLRALCNIYGVPSQLLNDPDNKTYSNTRDGEKALTVRCAIPMLESIKDQFNRKFQKDWGLKGRFIDYDSTVFEELQEANKDRVLWLKDAPLKLSRKLEILGESTEGYSQEQLDTIIIGQGYTTLDEVITPTDINLPAAVNDYSKSWVPEVKVEKEPELVVDKKGVLGKKPSLKLKTIDPVEIVNKSADPLKFKAKQDAILAKNDMLTNLLDKIWELQ